MGLAWDYHGPMMRTTQSKRSKTMKPLFAVYLPPDLDRSIRDLAEREERTLSWITEKALRMFLSDRKERVA